jgi:hypothetical protein
MNRRELLAFIVDTATDHSIDAVAIAGVVSIFTGLWLAWPPLALILLGIALLSFAVGRS